MYSDLTRKDPEPGNSKNSETLWICRGFSPGYNAIFFWWSNSLEADEINPGKFGYFPILCYNSWTVRNRKKVLKEKLFPLIRSIIW